MCKVLLTTIALALVSISNATAGHVASIRNYDDVSGCERYVIDYIYTGPPATAIAQAKADPIVKGYIETMQVIEIRLFAFDGIGSIFEGAIDATDENSACRQHYGDDYSGRGWVME